MIVLYASLWVRCFHISSIIGYLGKGNCGAIKAHWSQPTSSSLVCTVVLPSLACRHIAVGISSQLRIQQKHQEHLAWATSGASSSESPSLRSISSCFKPHLKQLNTENGTTHEHVWTPHCSSLMKLSCPFIAFSNPWRYGNNNIHTLLPVFSCHLCKIESLTPSISVVKIWYQLAANPHAS